MEERKNEKMEATKSKQATFGLGVAVLLMIVAVMFVGVMLSKSISVPTCLIIIITLICVISKFALKYSFDELVEIMANSLKNGTTGLLFFVAIGGIIASWMMAGTVPAIYLLWTETDQPKSFFTCRFCIM